MWSDNARTLLKPSSNTRSLPSCTHLFVLGLALLAATAPAAASDPEPPKISRIDQRFLTRVARRTITQQVTEETVYGTDYVPASLRDVWCQVVVTLRQGGLLRGVGTGQRGPVVTACREAAIAAIIDAARQRPVSPEWVGRIRIEIEAIGQTRPIRFLGRWDDEHAFDHLVEPGWDGVRLELGPARRQFLPSEITAKNITINDAIQGLAKQLALGPEQLASASLSRFRTTHWIELSPDDEVVELRRGLVPVRPEDVTTERLAKAIEHLVEHTIYRQLPSGLFAYQFEPSADRYTPDEESLVRQAGVTWALARHARISGKSASAAAAEQALRALTERTIRWPTVPDAAFIAGLRRQHKLGITALTALALFDHPQAQRYRQEYDRLLNGIYALQAPSGMFLTAFPPAETMANQHYFPGEALTAIAHDYARDPSQRATDAFDRAYRYYRDLWELEPSPALAFWHIQAFARMAVPTKRRDYAAFAFEMTDWLVDRQYTDANCPWPELRGGVPDPPDGRANVSTAAYLDSFTEALLLARLLGEAERSARYERAVRAAARFVLQLQVRPAEAYYAHSQQDTVWGIRTALTDNLLRIDNCQYALTGLMKARQVLFEDGTGLGTGP